MIELELGLIKSLKSTRFLGVFQLCCGFKMQHAHQPPSFVHAWWAAQPAGFSTSRTDRPGRALDRTTRHETKCFLSWSMYRSGMACRDWSPNPKWPLFSLTLLRSLWHTKSLECHLDNINISHINWAYILSLQLQSAKHLQVPKSQTARGPRWYGRSKPLYRQQDFIIRDQCRCPQAI